MENDKIIAELKLRGIRTYGKKLYKQAKVAFANVTGAISRSAIGASLTIRGTVESVFVPLAPGVPENKASYDLVEFIADEDGSGVTKTGVAWSVKKGQSKLLAM